ncbi:hypothetical protein EDEG_02241 [Edhazardia aedis USNM 41457]|uniref:Transcription initiation factor TFIID subunit 11 n=1 Tax=Edhazardia aedis (strain USNM 41457) TaxID=1003232 RepID=J9D6K1_EDHAE|nr:hypothetical protein EDEG_02241 [Edhazardia aedis USNM 41457]|eukprot:EJW03421.1 hypothetical protein EDEG_02241 [Edhazardia aedis USNM 41457]
MDSPFIMSDEETVQSQESSSEIEFSQTRDQKDEKERIQKIIDNMTEEELRRYETFRRAGFNKGGIRKICNSILNQSCNPNFILSVAGIAKVFAGEVIEAALEAQEEWGDSGPLLPSHIHEAYRRLYKTMPNMKTKDKNPFW